MATPTMTTAGLQQTDGANQTITVAGMTAWLQSVNGFRRASAGKRRLFQLSHEDSIRMSRRDVD